MENDFLAHHGIKGQKWGIRRFQNKDGTLTVEGKKRYGTLDNFQKQEQLKKAKSEYDAARSKESSMLGMFRSADKKEKIASDVAKKEYAFREATAEALHSKINTNELSPRVRKNAQRAIRNFQSKFFNRQISDLKKQNENWEFNYSSKGNIVGVSKKGETNMNMLFSLDPTLDAIYNSDGILVAKRK